MAIEKQQKDKGKQQKLHTHTRKQDGFAILQINEKDRKNLEQPYKSPNKKYVHIQASGEGQKDNESKALSLPDWNPQQEVGNFSVLLEIMPQASVKGIQ